MESSSIKADAVGFAFLKVVSDVLTLGGKGQCAKC